MRLFLSILLALACGGPESPAEPAAEPAASYELHEWGLLDVSLDGVTHFELAAGPGQPTPTVRRRPAPRRKPVIYVHATSPVQFQLEVMTSGPIAEHWPPTDIEGQTIRWQVEARPGACVTPDYPSATSPECANPPDGYCELADLPGYETSDGACLTVNGQTWDHLFYRSGGDTPALPVRVISDGTGDVRIENVSLAVPQGGVYRFRRSGGATLVQRIDMPAVGQSAVIGSLGSPVAPIRAELSGLLRSGGLTNAEAEAFEGAWFDELFDNGTTGGAPAVPNAIIYILPAAHLGPVSRLVAEPAPSQIKRMFWVRVAIR